MFFFLVHDSIEITAGCFRSGKVSLSADRMLANSIDVARAHKVIGQKSFNLEASSEEILCLLSHETSDTCGFGRITNITPTTSTGKSWYEIHFEVIGEFVIQRETLDHKEASEALKISRNYLFNSHRLEFSEIDLFSALRGLGALDTQPRQLIIFGPPGTGKSWYVNNVIGKDLTKQFPINTVFHPEYTYGDFIGRLLPEDVLEGETRRITYRFREGHFLTAVAAAIREYFRPRGTPDPRDVLLIIDEINRGNSAAIFGTIFQLLDRERTGVSSYGLHLAPMEREKLKELILDGMSEGTSAVIEMALPFHPHATIWHELMKEGKLRLPPNLHIVGTMNSSDESIYPMDTAFKRRWQWRYVSAEAYSDEHSTSGLRKELTTEQLDTVDAQDMAALTGYVDTSDKEILWGEFRRRLNEFIRTQENAVRKIEDKQIGPWFVRPVRNKIRADDIKYKLMFFLWDSVFARSREPLALLIRDHAGTKPRLAVFGDFLHHDDAFVKAVMAYPPEPNER